MSRLMTLGLAAAGLIAVAAAPASAAVIGSDVQYGFIHGTYDFTNASLNGAGPFLAVSPGSAIHFTADYTINDTNNSYCPTCIIQLYVGTGSPADTGSLAFASRIIESSSSGTVSWDFVAPATAGTYNLGSASTLLFSPVTVATGAGLDIPTETPGAFIAEILVTEPASIMVLGGALLGLCGLRRRA
ncbi:MAG TPA: hypothetical protein VE690_23145 [Rhodopila sp.]|nr:hypothetical protein [Rhodopila sp.]